MRNGNQNIERLEKINPSKIIIWTLIFIDEDDGIQKTMML